MLLLQTKVKTFSKLFSEKFGGKWKYDGRGTWYLQKLKRKMNFMINGKVLSDEAFSRVSGCSCDYDCSCLSRYYLYSNNSAEWVL